MITEIFEGKVKALKARLDELIENEIEFSDVLLTHDRGTYLILREKGETEREKELRLKAEETTEE